MDRFILFLIAVTLCSYFLAMIIIYFNLIAYGASIVDYFKYLYESYSWICGLVGIGIFFFMKKDRF